MLGNILIYINVSNRFHGIFKEIVQILRFRFFK